METALTILFTAFFIFIIYKHHFFRIDWFASKYIVFVFIIKILAGVALSVIYTYYYTDRKSADIFKYFDDGNIIHEALYVNPVHYAQLITGINDDAHYLNPYLEKTQNWYKPRDTQVYNDNRSIIRFNAIVRIFSFGFFQVHNVFMNFLSLMGLVALLKVFKPSPGRKFLFPALLFFMPSVLLWGSGVLKEGILLSALGMLVYHFFKLCNVFRLDRLLLVFVFTFLLAISKFYILAAILPAMLAFLWVKISGNRFALLKYVAANALVILVGLNIHLISPDNNAMEMMVRKQKDFIALSDSLGSGSRIDIPALEPNVLSFIKNSLPATATTLVRPHIFEAHNPFTLLASVENIFIIVLFSLIIISFRKLNSGLNTFFFCLSFFIVLYMLIGLTTPVMGAIVRYKVPALPFLAMAICIVFNKENSKIP